MLFQPVGQILYKVILNVQAFSLYIIDFFGILVIGNNRPVFLAIYKLIILLRKEVTVAELAKRAFHSSIRSYLH